MKNIFIHIANILLLAFFCFKNYDAQATHSMGMDLTYECLGADTFQITLAFYRDCAGINAPGSPGVNISSVSCGQNFVESLSLVSVKEITPICTTYQTVCSGGSYPGAEEYIYQGVVILPAQCSDWVLSYSLCCRNYDITTINNPGSENIHVETLLDNTWVFCNNSPVFSNNPVPFICIGKSYCFNHGATDADGDSLVYSLITPSTGPGAGDTVDYFSGYSAVNPLTSTPPLFIDPLTGDICMTPAMLEVTVLAVKVEEWRNGVFIGSVIRDIQVRVIDCPNANNLPWLDGIDSSGSFSASACAGQLITFSTNSYDIDTAQTLTLSWNQGIPGASFSISGGVRPTGSFSWTPDTSHISNTPHCFTVEVVDDNCPFLGSQVYSFCITVYGLTANIDSVKNISCKSANDGEATVIVTGGTLPYSYLWNTNPAQTGQTASGLDKGNYTVTVTDANGCIATANVTINEPKQLNVNIAPPSHVTCYDGSDGQAIANATGGTPPFSFLWNTNPPQTTDTATGLSAGTYTVTVTDLNGCVETKNVNINQPNNPMTVKNLSVIDVSCYGEDDGEATVQITGGGPPTYSYVWIGPDSIILTGHWVTGLAPGTYTLIVTNSIGCDDSTIVVVISEPPELIATIVGINVSCNGNCNGSADLTVSGGTMPYSFSWSDGSDTEDISALCPGLYVVNLTDSNGCTISDSVNISEPVALNTSIAGTNVSCNGVCDGVADLTVSGGTTPYSYSWSNGAASKDIASLCAGTYIVDITDANSCVIPDTVIISEPLGLTASIAGTDVICNRACNGASDLTVTGGTPPYSYIWSNGATSENIASLCAGTYTVEISDANSCIISDTITINQRCLVADFDVFGNGCRPLTVSFINNTLYADSYIWNFGDGATSLLKDPTHTYYDKGTYSVTLIAYGPGGQDTLTKLNIIVVHELPIAAFVVNPEFVFLPAEPVHCINLSENADSYLWDFGDGVTSDEANPYYNYTFPGEYIITLIARNQYGCSDTLTKKVLAKKGGLILIPNAFAPEQPQDNIFIALTSGVISYKMQIFNRWGELIFETTNADAGWDGYYRGELSKQDVYVWKIGAEFMNGERYKGVGNVTLLR
ncbi:MAG: PKD domain-containing protein [Cytophagales bacterium]|nr:PKD domain-containing protein [Cytophagales bacterium]